MLNVHHLELFYYVARHGGISPAVRHMPYGIQQPAVSGQILQLEETLGTKLFNRRPFALTPPGERLYAFIAPFFSQLRDVDAELRGAAGTRLRLAASTPVLRDHLPGLLHELRKTFPRITPHLHEASHAQAEALLQKQEIDLAITELDGKPAPGLKSLTLLRLPLALLLPADSPIKTVRQLLARESLDDLPLIAFPESATITKLFQNDLRRQGRRWPVAVEVNALELVETYAAEGFGIGLSLALPEGGGSRDRKARTEGRGLRRLPLGSGFAPLVVAALWQGRLAPLPAAFLELVKARAGQVARESV